VATLRDLTVWLREVLSQTSHRGDVANGQRVVYSLGIRRRMLTLF